MQIKNYTLVASMSVGLLNDKIQSMLKTGWQLHGNLIAFDNQLIQPMVQYYPQSLFDKSSVV